MCERAQAASKASSALVAEGEAEIWSGACASVHRQRAKGAAHLSPKARQKYGAVPVRVCTGSEQSEQRNCLLDSLRPYPVQCVQRSRKSARWPCLGGWALRWPAHPISHCRCPRIPPLPSRPVRTLPAAPTKYVTAQLVAALAQRPARTTTPVARSRQAWCAIQRRRGVCARQIVPQPFQVKQAMLSARRWTQRCRAMPPAGACPPPSQECLRCVSSWRQETPRA